MNSPAHSEVLASEHTGVEELEPPVPRKDEELKSSRLTLYHGKNPCGWYSSQGSQPSRRGLAEVYSESYRNTEDQIV